MLFVSTLKISWLDIIPERTKMFEKILYVQWLEVDGFWIDGSFMLTAWLMVVVSDQSAKMLCWDYCVCEYWILLLRLSLLVYIRNTTCIYNQLTSHWDVLELLVNKWHWLVFMMMLMVAWAGTNWVLNVVMKLVIIGLFEKEKISISGADAGY